MFYMATILRAGTIWSFNRFNHLTFTLITVIFLSCAEPLDDEMCKHGFYVRFMDDWAIMVKTKHQLRKVIKLTHEILNEIKLKMHPDKTFLGYIKKGFDFLGVHFGALPTIAKACQDKRLAKLAQRQALGASAACIGDYVARLTQVY